MINVINKLKHPTKFLTSANELMACKACPFYGIPGIVNEILTAKRDFGIIAQMERSVLLDRQKQGIEIAKAKGVYKGGKPDTNEDVVKFLSKPKNKAALEYIKSNLTLKEVAKLSGVHINTLTKIKKLSVTHPN